MFFKGLVAKFAIFKWLKKWLYIIPITALLAVSCTKKTVPGNTSLLGLDYYPTETGKYVIYDVDSIVYTDLPKDTNFVQYRIKEKLADTYTDNQGKTAIRLERYIKKYNPLKNYDSIPWSMNEVWMVNATNQSVQVVEANNRYTKLIFPVEEKASWNGNAYNTREPWTYSYEYIDKAETIGNMAFNNVLKVNQKYSSTAITFQSYYEKYAKGVGLVYREISDLVSNKKVTPQPVQNRIETGVVCKQTYVSSGYE